MERKNCWEAKKCGRRPGGEKVDELGVCPAAESSEYDGTNKGTYNGRFCWVVTGTICNGKAQDTVAKKLMGCFNCEFLKQVNEEEGRDFILGPKGSKKRSKPEA